VFGCPELVEITPGDDGHWRFACDGEHTEREIVDYLQCDTRMPGARWGQRAWEAMMLARTPEAWSQLLLGKPVPEDQLDPEYLLRARQRGGA
jgi:hypothetical protein